MLMNLVALFGSCCLEHEPRRAMRFTQIQTYQCIHHDVLHMCAHRHSQTIRNRCTTCIEARSMHDFVTTAGIILCSCFELSANVCVCMYAMEYGECNRVIRNQWFAWLAVARAVKRTTNRQQNARKHFIFIGCLHDAHVYCAAVEHNVEWVSSSKRDGSVLPVWLGSILRQVQVLGKQADWIR